MIRWDWNTTFKGIIKVGLLSLGLVIVIQNILFLNAINSFVPIGYLILLILSILTLRHIYRVFKWYSIWVRVNKNFENIIIHGCLYLIVISIIISISIQLDPKRDLLQNVKIENTPPYYKIPEITNIKIPDILQYTDRDKKEHPSIINANEKEREYIINILNNTDPEIKHKIKSIHVVVNDDELITYCEEGLAAGCASNDGTIYIMSISYWDSPHLRSGETIDVGAGYHRCSTFAWTLNHEIGHIKGYMVDDSSEIYAENYAYDHTTVNTVYEHEKRC